MFYFIKIENSEGQVKTSLRFTEKHRALQVFEYMADLCEEKEVIMLTDSQFNVLEACPCRQKSFISSEHHYYHQ